MAFGLRVWDSGGTLLWDTNTAGGGIVADIFSVGSGSSFSKTYADFAGATCRVLCPAYFSSEGSTVDTALGYPRVNVAAGLPRQLIVLMY